MTPFEQHILDCLALEPEYHLLHSARLPDGELAVSAWWDVADVAILWLVVPTIRDTSHLQTLWQRLETYHDSRYVPCFAALGLLCPPDCLGAGVADAYERMDWRWGVRLNSLLEETVRVG